VAKVIDELARFQLKVARADKFDLDRPGAELQRLADAGSVLQLSKGFYALVPEGRRRTSTAWRPTIEGAGLGMAASLYGPDNVALIGPSAARAHRCYPRALGDAYIAVPKQIRPRMSIVGKINFAIRDIAKLDTVRIETDLGPGWATGIEQTLLDLYRNRPRWNITHEARAEMMRQLLARVDWDIIEQVAVRTRGVNTLRRLRSSVAISSIS